MNLLVDVGNTRVKWVTSTIDGFLSRGVELNAAVSHFKLVNSWNKLPKPNSAIISCVSADWLFELIRAAALELWPDVSVTRVVSEACAFGVTNAYRQPEKLGVDRWLAMVAARQYYSLPALIVDCGTAITLDWIDGDGRHLGGMICPGLTLMKQSLSSGTDALAFDHARYSPGLSNVTEAAIFSGVLLAVVSLIERVYSGSRQDALLLITGGDAELISEHLTINSVVDFDLVLRGLAAVVAGTV